MRPSWPTACWTELSPQQVAAAFIRLWREGRPAPEELMEPQALRAREPLAPRERARVRRLGLVQPVGRPYRPRRGRAGCLPKICDAGGIGRESIGAIRIRHDESYVQIAADVADRFGATAPINDEITMTRLDGQPSLDAPASRPRVERTDRAERPVRKPAPTAGARPRDTGHEARVKSARGGWVPDDAPVPEADRPVKAWKKKDGVAAPKGKVAWAKPKPKTAAAKPHRKGVRRPE